MYSGKAILRLGVWLVCQLSMQVWGQVGPYIVRYVPGNYRFDDLHLVEIYNDAPQSANLGGYLLITRDYSTRLPNTAIIPPYGVYRIGKLASPERPLNLQLSGHEDFLIRIYPRKVEGNYVLLLNRQQQAVDGFYHSQLRSVPFLPDTGSLILPNQQAISFRVPDENAPFWGYFPVGDDPAVGFARVAGKWTPTSSNPRRSVVRSIEFGALGGRYAQGIVSLKGTTRFEENVRELVLERAQALQGGQVSPFLSIATLKGGGAQRGERDYTYLDAQVKRGNTYYYRLRHVDVFGRVEVSKVAEVNAVEVPVEFWMEQVAGTPVVRFFSAFSQRVKIKLLDERYREVALLYDDLAYAEVQQLLELTRPLPPGRYTLLASTEAQRYWQSFYLRP